MGTRKETKPAMPEFNNYSWFNPYRQSATEEMQSLCTEVARMIERYEEIKSLRVRKRRASAQQKFDRLVEAFVCDLVYRYAMKPEDYLLVTRNKTVLEKLSIYRPSHYNGQFPSILDALSSSELNMIEQRVGQKANAFKKGRTTMVKPTKRLIDRITSSALGVDSVNKCNSEEIVILRGAKIASEGSYGGLIEYESNEFTDRLRAEIRTINDNLEVADIQFDESVALCDWHARRMHRMFTYGSFETGGRMYHGFWQQLSREQRQAGLTIQGESVVTLDYSQMALRLAYATVGEPLPEGDGYTLPGLEDYRSPVKRLINSMFFPRMAKWKLIPSRIRKKLPDNLSDAEVVDKVLQHHEALGDLWWTDIGHRLQRQESDIMVKCLLKCIDEDIVALQVHDALIAPSSGKDDVRRIMLETFAEYTGMTGSVTEE